MSYGEQKPSDDGGLVRTAQIIVSALVAGVLIFAGVVFFINLGQQGAPQGQAIISLVMAILGGSMIIARFVVPEMMTRQACRSIAAGTWKSVAPKQAGYTPPTTDRERLTAVFLTKTIVASALLEGGAFGNLVAFMLEGQWYSLVLGVVLGLAIAAGMPSRQGVQNWVDRQLRLVEELRGLPQK